jgi:hypothetical protein
MSPSIHGARIASRPKCSGRIGTQSGDVDASFLPEATTSSGRAGSVLYVDLDPPEGSEQAGSRPAMVVSYEPFHRVSLQSVL